VTGHPTGGDPAPHAGGQPPAGWRERERLALERLFQAAGRPPTGAERAKAEEITAAAEQWRTRRPPRPGPPR
jgi:hypothetical protein